MATMPDHMCEHHVGKCLTCGQEYDIDFEPTLHCHDDPDHPTEGYTVKIVIDYRTRCRVHKEIK